MKFDLPKDYSSIIKVIGVGGGGSNAVNHMFQQGIEGVDFVVTNTDQQALDMSPVPIKIPLGASLTEGRGAGSKPEMGRNAAIENIDDIKELLEKNTKMVFITAGMGGGTGTGAAPVIAQAAKEMGILTVGIVTMPFSWEGPKRKRTADEGIETIREQVDTLLVINNDKLREMCGNFPLGEAFAQADDVLTTASKGIAEIITRTGYINVDFEDVKTVMTNSGVAIMGLATAEGEDRAIKAVENAMASPLLNDNNIKGANYVLLNITFGTKEVLLDEISEITDYIKKATESSDDVIWGYGQDEALGEKICVTIIATGFNTSPDTGYDYEKRQERKLLNLDDEMPTLLTNPLNGEEKEEELSEEIMLKEDADEEEEPTTPPVFSSSFETEAVEEDTEEDIVEAEAAIEEEEIKEIDEVHTYLPDKQVEEKSNDEPSITDDITGTEETISEDEPETIVDEPAQEDGISRWNDTTTSIPVEENEPTEETVAETTEPDEQRMIEFDLTSSPAMPVDGQEVSDNKEPYLKTSGKAEEKPVASQEPEKKKETTENDTEVPPSVQQKKSADRITKLKELSMKLRTPSGISDLENEPAYKRKNVQLDDTPHSSESEVSKYTLTETEEDEDEEGEKKTEIKPNNSFLHDNVD